MSIIIGKRMLITVMETELECPICTAIFDASKKMSDAKFPVFETNCPSCKGKIGIKIPIFGGTTECFELDVPKCVKRGGTVAPFTVNGKEFIEKFYDDNPDEPSDIFV